MFDCHFLTLTYNLSVPPYDCRHTVLPAPWSYPEDIVSMVIEEDSEGGDSERVVDLSRRPPPYEGDPNFLQKLKEDLGIQVSVSLHFLSN